jgi:hypothetical protein
MIVNPVTHFPLINVHKIYQCGTGKGEYCVLHNPDPHEKLAGAPLDWNMRDVVMSRVCIHDQLHPDIDDAKYRARRAGTTAAEALEHTCDGCCGRLNEIKVVPEIIWTPVTVLKSFVAAREFAEVIGLRNDEWIWDESSGVLDVRQRK